MAKGRVVWLSFDGDLSNNWPVLHFTKKGVGYIDTFCPKIFKKVTGFQLPKPTDTPIKVRITVERVK